MDINVNGKEGKVIIFCGILSDFFIQFINSSNKILSDIHK